MAVGKHTSSAPFFFGFKYIGEAPDQGHCTGKVAVVQVTPHALHTLDVPKPPATSSDSVHIVRGIRPQYKMNCPMVLAAGDFEELREGTPLDLGIREGVRVPVPHFKNTATEAEQLLVNLNAHNSSACAVCSVRAR